MKIIAVMNQKGGVGKTMTSAAIAYILGEEMKNRVLIADADQQGNVSMLYGVYDPEGLGMPELLEAHQAAGGAYSTKELIQQTTYSNIQIIPANGYLMRTNAELLLVEREDQILRFSAAMNEVRTEYDYCIVDCGLLLDMTVENSEWLHRHFAKFEDGIVYAWDNGRTSWSLLSDEVIDWKYAKLAEESNG